MTSLPIQRAQSADSDEIFELVREGALPVDGIRDHIRNFFLVREEGTLIGVIGLEIYGEDGLLRSLVVRKQHRARGIGNALYRHLLAEARQLGVKRLILLTTTAEAYFKRRGFKNIDRTSIAGPLTRSAEFNGACPSTAACMERSL
jgi:amino-acid N-acetyltransferase